ncbi:MAG: hypothetical protein ABJA78_16745 [Ferruginibacter sp.]
MRKINLLLLVFLSTISIVNAQNVIAPKKAVNPGVVAAPITRIISVVLSLDSTIHQPNATSYHHYFKATISSIGLGTYNCKWIITNSGPPAAPQIKPGSITLSGTGTDYIYIQEASGNSPIHHQIKLLIEDGNALTSNLMGY